MKRLIAFIFALLLCCSWACGALASGNEDYIAPAVDRSIQYLHSQKPGNWSLFVHALHQKEFAKKALSALELDILEHEKGGFRSLTELERTILNAIAAGKYPDAAEGVDLLSMLGGYSQLTAQGLESAAMALLAVDALDSELPEASLWSRPDAVQSVLYFQTTEGGFAPLAGRDPEPAATALALTALSPYRGRPEVEAAISAGLGWLSAAQNRDGSYSGSPEGSSCKSTAAVLTALCSLGISPEEDGRFIKEHSLPEALLRFQAEKGGFSREVGQSADTEATEQALIALAALRLSDSPYRFAGRFSPEKVKTVGESMASFFGMTALVVALIYGALLLTGKIGEKFGKPPLPRE